MVGEEVGTEETAQPDTGKLARGLLAEATVLLEELAKQLERDFPSSGM
jgi:hypothetical protein